MKIRETRCVNAATAGNRALAGQREGREGALDLLLSVDRPAHRVSREVLGGPYA